MLPKFLGGEGASTILVGLSKDLHTKYHGGLLHALHERGIWPKKGQAWEPYLDELAGRRDEALRVLMEYTQQFDAQHGTNLAELLLEQLASKS